MPSHSRSPSHTQLVLELKVSIVIEDTFVKVDIARLPCTSRGAQFGAEHRDMCTALEPEVNVSGSLGEVPSTPLKVAYDTS